MMLRCSALGVFLCFLVDIILNATVVHAVIVHADFSFGNEGFAYEDDTFRGTSEPAYAAGSYQPTGGKMNGCLNVNLGGVNGIDIADISGGWVKSFSISETEKLLLVFDFQVSFPLDFDEGEYLDVLVSFDGSLISGSASGFGPISRYLGGRGGFDTQYKTISLDLGMVTAGSHTLIFGGYINQKTTGSEVATIRFDSVIVMEEDYTGPTTLAPGDVAIVQYNADDEDNFAFVALVSISPGTEIMFTDSGWYKSGSFRTDEGVLKWTASSYLFPGTVVTVIPNSQTATSGTASNSKGVIDFQEAGDQLFAYQESSDSINLIFAMNNQGSSWQMNAGTVSKSADPVNLPSYAKLVMYEIDNAAYTGIGIGTKEELLAAITDRTNWTRKNKKHQTVDRNFVVLLGSTPDPAYHQPTVSSTASTIVDVDFNDGAVGYGFDYTTDIFVDGDEQFTMGFYVGVKGKPDVMGEPTGGLFLQLGGGSDDVGYDMSAGYRHIFTADVGLQLRVRFDYQVVWTSHYESDEHTYVKVAIDGERVYNVDFFDSTSPDGTTAWKEASIELGLVEAGTHFFDVGGVNNKKNHRREKTLIYLDNIYIWGVVAEVVHFPTLEPTPAPSIVINYDVMMSVDFDDPKDASGFAFTNDLFIDGDEQFTFGYYVGAQGKPDEATGAATAGLLMQLGGTTSELGEDMSAGFRRQFTTDFELQARIEFDYQVFWPSQYDDGDNCRVMLGINGGSIFMVDYFDNSSPSGISTWRTAIVDIGFLDAGSHYMDIGGTNNVKDHIRERTIIYIDNVKILAATTTMLATGPTAAPSLPSTCRTIDTSRTYRIISRKTGKPIQVKNGSTALGAEIAQNLMGNSESFMWTFKESDNGRYRIINKKTNYEMRVLSASTVRGAAIIQGAVGTNLSNGNWCLKGSGDGYYRIVVDHSGFVMVLPDSTKNVKQTITQGPYKDFLDRQWFITPVDTDWGDRHVLGLVPVAAANLPDGRVLTWSAYKPYGYNSGFGKTYTSIFDPTTGQATETVVENTSHDMFCPGTAILPDSRVMITGGSDKGTDAHQTTFYDPQTNVWSSGPLLNIPRGYHAMAVLTDGSVFTLGGSFSHSIGGKDGEVWDVNTNMWVTKPNIVSNGSVLTNDFQGVYSGDNHMWLFTAPNGLVFHAGPSKQMHWIDPKGDGSMLETILRGDHGDAMNGNAVMYDTGKIFVAGGSRHYRSGPANDRCYVIDINGGIGGVSVTRQGNMASERTLGNSVVLPSGEIIVVGGTRKAKIFSDQDAVMFVEIWSPKTGEFAKLDDMSIPRTYHSFALLLKDGRVLSGGGGLCGEDCAFNHFDMQIFTPPYLLKADGTPRQRPMILVAPDSAVLGEQITVTMNVGSIRTFALTRLGAVTHSINNDARRIPVSFVRSGGKDFHLSIPENGSIALPGVYHLFALNTLGVPSIATILSISAGS